MSKPLRQTMPRVAEFLDALREDDFFPASQINASLRAGLDGQPVFWARENGQEVGTRCLIDPERNVTCSAMQLGPVPKSKSAK